MVFEILEPSEHLKKYIYRFHISEITVDMSEDRRLVVPSGHSHLLLVTQGEVALQTENHKLRVAGAVISGQHDKAYRFNASLGSKLISVLFQPTALHLLTGIEMSKLYRKHTLLRNYLGISACELSIDLKKIDKSKDQLPFIEAFISRLVAERKPAFGIVEEIAQIIRAHDGLVQISELAEKYNISSKHLENTFKSQVGITPGKYAKVIRFWRVYQSLLANLSFSEGIEEAFGYYDKSHFRKDFKLFTGFTPEEIIDEQKKKMEHYVKELKLK